jgi:hypothetical protein
MKVIAKPTEESKVLASAKKDAKAEDIYKGIVARAEYCVDHLCGCSCKHKGC